MVMATSQGAIHLGGSSDPAYYFSISALHPDVAPTKNKRSTHLIQGFMLETLGISPSRGVVRFEGVAEENVAINGMTALQEIEATTRRLSSDNQGYRDVMRQRSRKSVKNAVHAYVERGRAWTPAPHAASPSHWKSTSDETNGTKSTDPNEPQKKRLKHRRSIMAFFRGRNSE